MLLTFNMWTYILGVIMVGKDSSVMSVSATQAVLMGAVMNHGSVIVKPTGVACSVTKVLNINLKKKSEVAWLTDNSLTISFLLVCHYLSVSVPNSFMADVT